MIDVSQSTEYFLIISAKPELKPGQRLVDGRIVNVRLRNSAEILVDCRFIDHDERRFETHYR